MADVIRASALSGYRELVSSLGGDPDALLERVGIEPSLAGDVEAFIGFRELLAANELAAAELHTPDFGLRLGSSQSLGILGPVAMIGRHSGSIGEALDGISQFMHVYSPAMSIDWSVDGDVGTYVFDFPAEVGDMVSGAAQTYESSLALTVQVARLLAGNEFVPLSVWFRHHPGAPHHVYEEFFGCPVRGGADNCGGTFPAAILDLPVRGSDPEIHRILTDYLGRFTPPSRSDLADDVSAILKRLLSTGYFSISAVAEQLHVHPRTLQRRLAAAGTTFEAVLDRTRKELAEYHLKTTDMPLYQLSRLLGYTTASSVSRSSLRWFGMTPRAVRAAGRRLR